MKLSALMCTYKNLEFFKCAYKQAKNVCDNVYVTVGPHSFSLEHSPDVGTMNWLDAMGQEFTTVMPDKDMRYDMFQCSIWHGLTNKAVQNGTNWFRYWDDDMFFFDDDIYKLRSTMSKSNVDCIGFLERRFIWNFKCCTSDTTGYFYRVTKGMFLSPISKVHYEDGNLYRDSKVLLGDVICHHYTAVKTKERQLYRSRLSSEKGTVDAPQSYAYWESGPIPPDKRLMPLVLGGTGFEMYEGKHPEVLDDHPWRYIEDVRKI